MPVNLYGPRDNFDLETSHVIPAMIRKMIAARDSGSTVTLWGDGTPTREFLFVEDCARAIVLAAERYDGSEPVNLGAGWEISIKDLAELIAEAVGYKGDIVWDTTKPNGQPRRKLDVSRAKEWFGFEAEVPFDEGIRRTVGVVGSEPLGPRKTLGEASGRPSRSWSLLRCPFVGPAQFRHLMSPLHLLIEAQQACLAHRAAHLGVVDQSQYAVAETLDVARFRIQGGRTG